MREEDDREGDKDEEDADEEGFDRDIEEVVEIALVVRLLEVLSLARFDGVGGSFAFPFPLSSAGLDSGSSSCSSGSSVIAFRLISEAPASPSTPLIVIVLVELLALCLAFPFLGKILLELFTLIRSSSFPAPLVFPTPSISIIFLLKRACAVPF